MAANKTHVVPAQLIPLRVSQSHLAQSGPGCLSEPIFHAVSGSGLWATRTGLTSQPVVRDAKARRKAPEVADRLAVAVKHLQLGLMGAARATQPGLSTKDGGIESSR